MIAPVVKYFVDACGIFKGCQYLDLLLVEVSVVQPHSGDDCTIVSELKHACSEQEYIDRLSLFIVASAFQ